MKGLKVGAWLQLLEGLYWIRYGHGGFLGIKLELWINGVRHYYCDTIILYEAFLEQKTPSIYVSDSLRILASYIYGLEVDEEPYTKLSTRQQEVSVYSHWLQVANTYSQSTISTIHYCLIIFTWGRGYSEFIYYYNINFWCVWLKIVLISFF